MLAGTHRVQRVPDGTNRRHTSTVTVAVLDADRPTVEPLDPADVDVQAYRGSGPGGQKRNVTDSCVRAIHKPTGTVVVATESTSQWQNKQMALAELTRRVAEQAESERTAATNANRSEQVGSGGRGGFAWNWCGWRDEVIGPAGQRMRMSAALKGRIST